MSPEESLTGCAGSYIQRPGKLSPQKAQSNEWHCKKCNDCTFGLTLPCDSCGKKSPYA